MARIKLKLALTLVSVSVFGASLALAGFRYADQLPADASRSLLSAIDPSEIPGITFGVPGAVASVLWMRTTTQIGGWYMQRQLKGNNLGVIAAQTVATARLDPMMQQPFVAASAHLANIGAPLNVAHETLLTSLQGQSRNWRVYFWMGYTYYRYFGDSATASQWWKLTALMPGAPWYIANLAQFTMLQQTGKIDPLLEELSEGGGLVPAAQAEWRWVEEFREMQRVARYDLLKYQRLHGVFPTSVQDMVDARIWRRPPTDPWGGEVGLSPKGNEITISERAPIALRSFADAVAPDPALHRGVIPHWRAGLFH